MAKIIAAIDGGPHSAPVLEWALDHSNIDDEVVAMLVWNLTSVGGFENPFGNLNESQLEARRTAMLVVEAVAKRRSNSDRVDPEVEISVPHGDPAALLIAATELADLIVLGGFRTGMASVGSVAKKVAARAQCAVTLVPSTVAAGSEFLKSKDASLQS